MKNAAHRNDSRTPAPSAGDAPVLARVSAAASGMASEVVDIVDGSTHPVAGHLESVASLHRGDTVCVLDTPSGAVVVGRLRGCGEPPAAVLRDAGGCVEVSAEQSIAIRTGRSRIELSADGVVRVDGTEVHQIAERRLALTAATVEVN